MRIISYFRFLICLIVFSSIISCATTQQAINPKSSTLIIDKRSVEVFSWLPKGKAAGVILFSHGAASSPLKYDLLINQWVEAGYAIHAALHVDSTDHPENDKYKGMASWVTRLEDMQLLANTFGQKGYVAAGHSYGGLLALTAGGVTAARPPGYLGNMKDNRVSMVLAFSPPAAIPGFVSKENFENISVPALIQTGTKDIPFGSKLGWESHLDAFEMAPEGGDRYALIIEDVDHYFGGAICRPELPGPKQIDELNIAANVSLLMLEAYSKKNSNSLAVLQSQLQSKGSVILKAK